MVQTILRNGIERGKHLLGGKQESIISAAFIMMVLLAVTKVVGLAKIHFFASIFGASKELDIFWAAFTVPDIIFNVIVLGSVNAALIPSFAEALKKGEIETLYAGVIRMFLVVFTVLSIGVFVCAPGLARAVSSGGLGDFGFEGGNLSAVDVELLAKLMRLMILSPIILGTSSVITAGLQVQKRFVIPALAPLFYNIGIIIGAVVFASAMGFGIEGLAWGVVLGALLHVAIQVPLASKLGLKINLFGPIFPKGVLSVVKLALPRILGLVGEQISILVNTIISMGLGSGALSAFCFGSSIYLLPVQLFGSTIAQAALPTLSLEYQESEQPTLLDNETASGKKNRVLTGFSTTFSRTLQQILFFILPAAVFFVVLRLPIVRLVLEAGAFDWEDTVVTSWVLALFGLALVMNAVSALVVRAFFAMQDTIAPLVVSVICLIVNVVGSIYLTNFFSHYYDWRPFVEAFFEHAGSVTSGIPGEMVRWFTTRNSSLAAVGGLALSAGLAALVEVVVLMVVLNRRVRVLSWKTFWQPLFKKLFAIWVMFVAMYSVYKWWNFRIDTSTVVSIGALFVVVGGIGVALYLWVSLVIEIAEVRFFVRIIRGVYGRVRSVLGNRFSGEHERGEIRY